jgi:hypothetical protein
MVWHFDHRFTTCEGATQEQLNAGSLPQLTPEQKTNTGLRVIPRHWLTDTDFLQVGGRGVCGIAGVGVGLYGGRYAAAGGRTEGRRGEGRHGDTERRRHLRVSVSPRPHSAGTRRGGRCCGRNWTPGLPAPTA